MAYCPQVGVRWAMSALMQSIVGGRYSYSLVIVGTCAVQCLGEREL